MENQTPILNRTMRIGILPVIFLSVFVLSGCDKEEVNLSEMQNKLSEQQAQIEELQGSKDEQQKIIEEQQTTIDELEKPKETSTNEVKPTVTKSVADEVYCQTNASKYSTETLNNKKKGPSNEEKLCEKSNEMFEEVCKNSDKECDRSNNCDDVYKKAMKEYEEYKAMYDAYHKKCG